MAHLDYQIVSCRIDDGGGYCVYLLRDGAEIESKRFAAYRDADPEACMAWFNSLNDSGRRRWLAEARSNQPKHAYTVYAHRRAFSLAEEAGQSWNRQAG